MGVHFADKSVVINSAGMGRFAARPSPSDMTRRHAAVYRAPRAVVLPIIGSSYGEALGQRRVGELRKTRRMGKFFQHGDSSTYRSRQRSYAKMPCRTIREASGGAEASGRQARVDLACAMTAPRRPSRKTPGVKTLS